MKFRTIVKTLTCMALSAVMMLTACAAFGKKNEYKGQFTDVKESSWYAKEVASAFELGFVKGTSDTQYSPNGSVTVAEAVTMASRVHAEYNGKTIAEKSGGKWYDAYVDYAKKNGIISENQFDDYARQIKRHEMAEIFHDAMGKDYYKPVNDVVFVPDVPLGAYYLDKLLTLYNAGVVMGSDEYGSFNPDADIKRSECAAIINRVALPANRLKKELKPFTSEDAYVLCYNVGMGGSKENINSGWIIDNRGGPAKTENSGATAIGDVSEKYAACYIREFNFIPAGRLVAEIELSCIDNGGFLEFTDIEGNPTYQLKIVDGVWNILKKDGYVATGIECGEARIRAVVDLDNGTSETYINDVFCSGAELLSDNILSCRIGVDEKGVGSVVVHRTNMVVNYGIYEDFDIFEISDVYGWIKKGFITRNASQANFNTNSELSKKFDKALDGTVCAETYFISRDGKNFEINLGQSLKLESKDGKLVCGDQEYYNITKNMWYRLRVVADTVKGEADILLNGRSVGKAKLASGEKIDEISFKSGGFLCIDNLHVFEMHEYSDYVPKPTAKANFDDYIVGLNICSLWRNGTHYGWACVSPFDEAVPVIGMYDEGNPETADWEIKYMVEHGIDFQAFCWYAEKNDGAIKCPNLSNQLHDGYMYAKYSDYMKYCILWEAQSAERFNAQFFRRFVVPYWFENYFLDPRYMTIDNQLVLPVFGAGSLPTDDYFGSISGVKAEFNYLESVAKSYGFDGFILLAAGSSTDQLAQMGFDGTYAYNWGTEGKKYEHNVNSILSSAKNKRMYTVPTVSVGFDSIPWHGLRHGNMTTEDLAKSYEWVKDTYLPQYSGAYDWADRLTWLSTWNEYGEGTYMMPSGLNGFGYVDEVRRAYTELPEEHEDVVPTPKQRERINHLYPQYEKLLRRSGWYYKDRTEAVAKAEVKNKLFINDVDVQTNAEDIYLLPPMEKDGKILFPFNPSAAVHYVLGCHYEYRKDAGTLKILANGHEVLFKIGYDRYYLDGVEKDLGYAPELFDGIVMLDFEKLASDLGYKTQKKNGDVYVYTDTYESLWKALGERETGVWEFNNPYDNEGFTSTHVSIVTRDGAMKMTTLDQTNDPITFYASENFPKDFFAKKFSAVEVKCRYKYTTPNGEPSHLSFYYITDRDGNYAENKNLKLPLKSLDSNGEWEICRLDITGESNWQSVENIIGLRFDPFNGQGEIEIDYIRFITDPNFKYIPIEERPIEISNGDAENDIVGFFSGNANVSIVRDPDNMNNRVWKVEAKRNELYIYFQHLVRFKPNTSYKIDFDIRLLGPSKEGAPDTANFNINLRYLDKGALNDHDHIVRTASATRVSASDGWVHCTATYTTGKVDSYEQNEFTIYMDPYNDIGYSYYVDNVVVKEIDSSEIKAPEKKTFDWKKAEGKMLYSFDNENDKVSVGNVKEYSIENGCLRMVAEGEQSDAQVYPGKEINFSSEEYKTIAVRFKAEDIVSSAPFFQVFFETDIEPGLSEDKSLRCSYDTLAVDSEGFMTAVFELSQNLKWKGNITGLRFDPNNSGGIFCIDKIMLVK